MLHTHDDGGGICVSADVGSFAPDTDAHASADTGQVNPGYFFFFLGHTRR